ncbi:MAG: YncE family protein [Gaiellaceae bacterium]
MVFVNRREFVTVAAGAPFALRTTLAAAASAPSALVTCDAESRLAIVDLGSFRAAGSIATLADPRSIELVGDRAVVCHTAVGPLSIVDRHGVRHVVHGLEEPRYTAAHPDGVHAFVTDSGRSGVVALDVARGKLLGRAPLGGWARHLGIDAAGTTLWVGLGTASTEIAVVDVRDPARPRHVHTVRPPFLAHDVSYAPDGRVWVTSGEQRSSAIYHAGRSLVSLLGADLAPQHVTFGNGLAYVTSGDSGLLRVHTLAGRVIRTTSIPVGSYNVQQGHGRVLTPSLERGTLTVLDRRGALLARVQVAGSCHDACFLPR